MRLDRLAVPRCSLEDRGAERCTSRLGRVLDEHVLTACGRPRRVVTAQDIRKRADGKKPGDIPGDESLPRRHRIGDIYIPAGPRDVLLQDAGTGFYTTTTTGKPK